MKTKRKEKRLLTILLAFVMVVGLIPTTVFAGNTSTLELQSITITGVPMPQAGDKVSDYNEKKVESVSIATNPAGAVRDYYITWYNDEGNGIPTETFVAGTTYSYRVAVDMADGYCCTKPTEIDAKLNGKKPDEILWFGSAWIGHTYNSFGVLNKYTIPVAYTISFDMNGHGTQVDAQKVNKGAKATKPTDPTAEGYNFMGWYTDKDCTDGNEFDFILPIKTGYTLYAKWEKNAQPTNPNSFSVTVPIKKTVVQGGTNAPGATTFTFELTARDTDYPTLSVEKNTLTVTGAGEVSGDIKLSGTFPTNYSGISYTLTEKNDGKTGWTYDEVSYIVIIDKNPVYDAARAETGEYTYDVKLQKEKEGFNPIGVKIAEFTNTYTNNQPPVQTTTYTISFDMNGHGTQVDAQTVNEGAKATKPADPTAEGYNFKGWYADENLTNEFDFETAIKADTTVYAKWEKKADKPAETNPTTGAESPKTSDNSNMALWIALLFVSGIGVFGTTVYSKKKKSIR